MNEVNLIKEVNRVFHDIEADSYDTRHPEVISGDREWWKKAVSECIPPGTRGEKMRIIDIGSGTGFVGEIVLKHVNNGSHFICYDLSLAMLEKSRQKLKDGFTSEVGYVNGEASRLPFRSTSFDIITMNALLHHLADYGCLLKEADRILKPGGYLIIAHEPNKLFFRSIITRFLAGAYKFLGGGKSISDEMRVLVNERLKAKGCIDKDLSREEILRMVDYHSPVEQHRITISKDKGFVPGELIAEHFSGYKVIELREYTTFFIRSSFGDNPCLSFLAKGMRYFFLGRGNLFSLILQK